MVRKPRMPSIYDDIDVFDDHPSLANSLEDFEAPDSSPELGRSRSSVGRRSPMREMTANRLNLAQSAHSMYRDDPDDSEDESEVSHWEPPAWRDAGLGFFNQRSHRPSMSGMRNSKSPLKSMGASSRFASPWDDNTIQHIAENVPLPRSVSPEKRSCSPFKRESVMLESRHETPADRSGSVIHEMHQSVHGTPGPVDESMFPNSTSSHQPNAIKLNLRYSVEAHHSLDFIQDALIWIGQRIQHTFSGPRNFLSALLFALIGWAMFHILFGQTQPLPSPDLSNLAHVAGNLEQNTNLWEVGHVHVEEMSETSVALWDLSETVKAANITAAAQISTTLDQLGQNLDDLAIEMTKFFSNVDGDIDNVIMVMEYTKRRLEMVPDLPKELTVSTAINNVHSALCKIGVLEYKNAPTALGRIVTSLFGRTKAQTAALEIFNGFYKILTSVEEVVADEQKVILLLIKFFEDIDRQFNSLHRLVLLEAEQQDADFEILLSSWWAHLSGNRALGMRKIEKNKALLSNLKKRTTANKHILMGHNHNLIHLRGNLESVRRQLISPLVRSNESTPLSMREQIGSIGATLEHLKMKRQAQKEKTRLSIIESSSRRRAIIRGEEGTAIEAS